MSWNPDVCVTTRSAGGTRFGPDAGSRTEQPRRRRSRPFRQVAVYRPFSRMAGGPGIPPVARAPDAVSIPPPLRRCVKGVPAGPQAAGTPFCVLRAPARRSRRRFPARGPHPSETTRMKTQDCLMPSAGGWALSPVAEQEWAMVPSRGFRWPGAELPTGFVHFGRCLDKVSCIPPVASRTHYRQGRLAAHEDEGEPALSCVQMRCTMCCRFTAGLRRAATSVLWPARYLRAVTAAPFRAHRGTPRNTSRMP